MVDPRCLVPTTALPHMLADSQPMQAFITAPWWNWNEYSMQQQPTQPGAQETSLCQAPLNSTVCQQVVSMPPAAMSCMVPQRIDLFKSTAVMKTKSSQVDTAKPSPPQKLDGEARKVSTLYSRGHGASPPQELDAASLQESRRPEEVNVADSGLNDSSADDRLDTHPEDDLAQAKAIADELLRQLKASAHEQWLAITRFQRLAFSDKISCRGAQLALEHASATDATLLASGLHGHVRRAVQSKFANYVVQKIVEIMPMARASFVAKELLGFAFGAARHRFGCRVVCRILEHLTPGDQVTGALLHELLAKSDELCSHVYGNYVIRHILEFGLPDHKHLVAVALLPRAAWHAKHKLGSHVVEAALHSCSPDDQLALARALLSDDRQLVAVVTSVFGRHVVRSMLFMGPEIKQRTMDALSQIEPQLRSSRATKDALQALYART